MNFAVGFSCLVTMAVIAVVTGLPQQEHAVEDKAVDFDEAHLSARISNCASGTKLACNIAGGMCQSQDDECAGELRTDSFYCSKSKKCGCCIPAGQPGCVYDRKAYPNNAIFKVECLTLTCKNGTLIIDDSECHDSDSNAQVCSCGFTLNKGCFLSSPKPSFIACRCNPTGSIYHPSTVCNGRLVLCNTPQSEACKEMGDSQADCLQGVGNGHGNCNGYTEVASEEMQ